MRPYPPILRLADASDDAVEFEEFYVAVLPKIYAFIGCQVRNHEIAQDIVSRTFVKVYEHWNHAPAGEAVIAWTFRIARNTLIDHWRVETRRASRSVSVEELAEVPSAASTPEVACARRERSELLLRAVRKLNDRDRILLALKFAGQRSNREAASILGISEAAVSMRLLRALRRLRLHLGDQGF